MSWIRTLAQRSLGAVGLELRRTSIRSEFREIPDAPFYETVFSPWKGYGEFHSLYERIRPYTLVSADRCWLLNSLARQARQLGAEFWECGVYRGGTAMLLQAALAQRDDVMLRLFDTFEGMPATSDVDLHREGDFADTSLTAVRARLAPSTTTSFHSGFIPNSFAGLESSRIALAHIDVDIHRSVLDCCAFIYPRIVSGGFMVFDDYGFPSCPGARRAVDDFFADKPETPLVLPTGQAVVFVTRRADS
jgi:O-methyltransferase